MSAGKCGIRTAIGGVQLPECRNEPAFEARCSQCGAVVQAFVCKSHAEQMQLSQRQKMCNSCVTVGPLSEIVEYVPLGVTA